MYIYIRIVVRNVPKVAWLVGYKRSSDLLKRGNYHGWFSVGWMVWFGLVVGGLIACNRLVR